MNPVRNSKNKDFYNNSKLREKQRKISNGVKRQTHTIDAAGRSLGRLATEITILLRGKHKPDFVASKDIGDFVIVENVDKLKISGKKLNQKIYYRYSGYPGGLKKIPMGKLKPREILKRAVFGMLPKNKLRAKMMKRLKIL